MKDVNSDESLSVTKDNGRYDTELLKMQLKKTNLQDVDALLKVADGQMYAEKKQG